MADDEQLREALLELQFLRQREASTLEETRKLAACLEAYSTAPTAAGARDALLAAAAGALDASVLALLTRDAAAAPEAGSAPAARVAAASDAALVGTSVGAPFDLFKRVRNISRAGAAAEWRGAFDLGTATAMLICPAGPDSAVLALRDDGQSFGKPAVALLERLAPLCVQAQRNAELAQEKDLLAAAIAGSSSGIAIADAGAADLPLIYVNAAFERLSGYDSDEVLGINCRFLAADAPDAPERTRLREAVRRREPGSFLLRNRRKSGELFWNALSLFPVTGPDGAVRNLVATQSDVSERIEAEQARDRTRAQMAMALSASEDAFLILEPDMTVALSNDAARALFPGADWTPGSTFAAHWDAYLASVRDLPGRVTRLLRAADLRALSRVPIGQELDLPDGRTVFVRCAALEDGGLVVTATDISPMRSAQNLLAQRLAAIEAAPDGIAVTDAGGRLTYLNSAAARLMGFGRLGVGLGRIWWHQYRNRVALERIAPFEPTLAELDNGGGDTHEVTSSPLEAGGHIILVRDVTEKLAQEAREEDLTQRLIAMQRQEALSQLTAGVAHDFNNYLAAINGSATLLDMAPDLPDALRVHVDRIASAGTQSARLVNRLLDMGAGAEDARRFDLNSALNRPLKKSAVATPVPKWADFLSALVELRKSARARHRRSRREMIFEILFQRPVKDLPELVRPLLPAQIGFDLFRSGDGLLLQGDPAALNDVLLNVILNARDAIGAQPGTITVTTTRLRGAEAPAMRAQLGGDSEAADGDAETLCVGTLKPGTPYAAIAIRDTGSGSGMDAATQKLIFEPYFSTKGARGTGLGMSMVAAQLRAVKGALGLISSPGRGTEMRLYWPVTDDTPQDAAHGSDAGVDLSGRMLIIVDDDLQVGEVMARYLEARGAEVAQVEDPQDALDAIAEDPEAWSAMITDYDMPRMNGGALAQRAAAAAPGLPIIVVTALARRLNDPRLERAQVRDILSKPVDLALLGARVAQVTEDDAATNDKAPDAPSGQE